MESGTLLLQYLVPARSALGSATAPSSKPERQGTRRQQSADADLHSGQEFRAAFQAAPNLRSGRGSGGARRPAAPHPARRARATGTEAGTSKPGLPDSRRLTRLGRSAPKRGVGLHELRAVVCVCVCVCARARARTSAKPERGAAAATKRRGERPADTHDLTRRHGPRPAHGRARGP